jgi:hypothetical protein
VRRGRSARRNVEACMVDEVELSVLCKEWQMCLVDRVCESTKNVERSWSEQSQGLMRL